MFNRREGNLIRVERRKLERVFNLARENIDFIKSQYRSGYSGAFLDDMNTKTSEEVYPIIKKALEVLGIPCSIFWCNLGFINIEFT